MDDLLGVISRVFIFRNVGEGVVALFEVRQRQEVGSISRRRAYGTKLSSFIVRISLSDVLWAIAGKTLYEFAQI